VVEVTLAGCIGEAIVRPLAICAKNQFGAASPADLHSLLQAQAEGGGCLPLPS
jgi:hypothetical protein